MSQAKFEKLVALYRTINFQLNSRVGVIAIKDEEQRNAIAELLAVDSDELGVVVLSGEADSLKVGDNLKLEVCDPKISIGLVATDLDELLLAPNARIKEPSRYFIISEKLVVFHKCA